MLKLVRSAAIAALALTMVGCAPVKLNTVPAAAYDSPATAEQTKDQAKALQHVREALKDRKLTAQVVADGSAITAARMLVNRQAEATGVLPSEARDILHESGIADVGARWFAVSSGYNDRIPNADDLAPLLDALGPVGGTLFAGAADVEDSLHNKRHWAVVVVPRVVALNGLSRRWEPSTRMEIKGRFLETVTTPRLGLQRADGSVEHVALVTGADGSFTQVIDVPAAVGQYLVEIGATFKGVFRVLVAAPVGVGVQVAPWPTRAADLAVASEKDLELALGKVVGVLRGKPMAEKKELTDTARACAIALADGKECAATPANIHLFAFDVANDSIERMVSEIVAMPTMRAAWKVEPGALAAAPTKSGHFVVAVAFPIEEAPKAVETKPVEVAPTAPIPPPEAAPENTAPPEKPAPSDEAHKPESQP